MAHGLTESDKMFFVGKTPWHGQGVELPSLATAAEAIAAANLGWQVVQEPVFTRGCTDEGKEYPGGIELDSKRINVRGDNGAPLGVVGDQYKILQNVEAFSFFDKVTQDPHGPKYETAGSLWGGRKVWMLARVPGCFDVMPGDPIEPYVLLSNSHDGSSAVRILLTPIRVVCQNTLNMAHTTESKGIRIRHSGDVMLKVGQAQDALGIIRHSFDETFALYQALAKDEPTKEEIDTVLSQLFKETKSARSKNQRERVLELAACGVNGSNEKAAGTAWGLYNGVTELVDHYNNAGSKRDDANDMRLNSLGMGSGLDVKADALQIIADVCLN